MKHSNSLFTYNIKNTYKICSFINSICDNYVCDRLFSKVIANTADRIHDLVPITKRKSKEFGNVRAFYSIPPCKTNRFKKAVMASSLCYTNNILDNLDINFILVNILNLSNSLAARTFF